MERKLELMKKYGNSLVSTYTFHLKGDIPLKKIDSALNKFAYGVDKSKILGFYDTTVLGSGKKGYVFTDCEVHYLEILSKPKKFRYEDIKKVEIYKYHKKDCNQELKIVFNDESKLILDSICINKTPLKEFLEQMSSLVNKENKQNIYNNDTRENKFNDSEITNWANTNQSKVSFPSDQSRKINGSEQGGLTFGSVSSSGNMYNHDKYATPQGHGFAAEDANHLYDILHGKDAKLVGNDNAKHGADRIVDGIEIQTKYCKTGGKCISECFEDGQLKYFNSDGRPMQIEVPSDKYNQAVQAMEQRIRNGEVKGVTDPSEAQNIVRKGNYTYEQAKNIAKAGNIDSIKFDAANGAIVATTAFGISATISFAVSIWNGEDMDIALKSAAFSGVKVGGVTFVSAVISSQLSKAGLNSALVASSEQIVSIMGPKASAVLVNALRSGQNIYGAAAMKSAAKLLRGNVITGIVTGVILESVDIVDIFRGRISGKQLFKNSLETATTIAGGSAGWIAGAAAGATVGSAVPIIGTAVGGVVGGIIGSVGAGVASSKVTTSITNAFIEDDAEEMVRIIENEFGIIANDYLLNQKEVEDVVSQLHNKLKGSILKDMYQSSSKRNFAENIILPIVQDVVVGRKQIITPSSENFSQGIKNLLEDIYNDQLPQGI